MRRVTLVRVNTTMGTICATTRFLERVKEISELRLNFSISSYRSLLNDNVFDKQLLDLNVFSIGI